MFVYEKTERTLYRDVAVKQKICILSYNGAGRRET